MKSGTHYKVSDPLTPRQEEILSLIAAGHTNSQIAEYLGITLDGAKWHVSEIIAKFGVDSREDAVEAWRAQESLGHRFGRGLHALLAPIVIHKLVIGGVTASAVAALAVGGFILANHGSSPSAQDLPHSSTFGQVVDNPQAFNRVQMIDSNVGWAQFQQLSGTGPTGMVIRTEDGARTWRNVSPALPDSETIHSAQFLDSIHAWVLVDQISPAGPPALQTRISRVAWTEDAGKTWRESAALGPANPVMPLGADRLGLTFADSQHGWVRDNAGTLFRTTDSGNTWHKVSVSSGTNSRPVANQLPASCLLGIFFRDGTHGYAFGACEDESNGLPILFRTDNGGMTWKRQALPLPGNPQQSVAACQCFVSLPSFPTALDGFVVLWSPLPEGSSLSMATSSLRTVYSTHDAGRTWQVVGTSHTGDTPFGGVRFVDQLHGWLAETTVEHHDTFRTVDGGLTWQQLPPGPLFQGNFVSPTEGWAISTPTPGANFWGVVHTLDGGLTWQPVSPGLTDPLAPGLATPPPGR